VDKEDIPRLDEGQCLNDNLIGYGLRYLFDVLGSRQEELHKRVYLHNSFFYEKLKAGRGAINYDGVKNWTAKVDLLSYDYIIVPVNEHYHWWVAIICNPGKLDPDTRSRPGKPDAPRNEAETRANDVSSDVEMTDIAAKPSLQSPGVPATAEPNLVKSDIVDLVSDDKNVSIDLTSGSRAKQTKKSRAGGRTYNPEDPRIITLDSLGSTHPIAINHLKKYLLAEFEHKRGKVIIDTPIQLGMRATNIPEQNNLCDCGVYLLGYIQEFVRDPDLFIRTLLRKEHPDWEFDPSNLRALWRQTIQDEHKSYQANQLKATQVKREASAAKRTPKGSAEPSRHPSRATSEVTNSANAQRKIGADFPEQPSSTKPVSPVNLAAAEDNAPISEPASLNPQPNGDSHSPVSAGTPQQQHPQQTNPDDSVVILPPQEEDIAVLPSIEEPEVEELPRPPHAQDEPRFLPKLASQPPSQADDDDDDDIRVIDPPAAQMRNDAKSRSTTTSSAQKRARRLSSSFGEQHDDDRDSRAEIGPRSFYTPNGGSSSSGSGSAQKRTALSSPTAAGQRQRTAAAAAAAAAAKTRASQKTYTSSRLAIAAAEGANLGPVVERAELVSCEDPIDLTDA
jgi:sentrin-specific protease 7